MNAWISSISGYAVGKIRSVSFRLCNSLVIDMSIPTFSLYSQLYPPPLKYIIHRSRKKTKKTSKNQTKTQQNNAFKFQWVGKFYEPAGGCNEWWHLNIYRKQDLKCWPRDGESLKSVGNYSWIVRYAEQPPTISSWEETHSNICGIWEKEKKIFRRFGEECLLPFNNTCIGTKNKHPFQNCEYFSV